ncbi:hypothetical protein SVAN01_01021 [Stagonosporopsis vannaccii]|nr:hypothetical protein SVAN01_01021 [Stagonosporopsis vannaccii]
MPSQCSIISQPDASSFNVTSILYERYQDAPKDDWDRLFKCWGISDCGDCHRSNGSCGWCPISSTCLPLPTDRLSRAFPLLTPVRYKGICAFGSERFELRTGGLGCQVSTITFLTAIVTIFATIFGLLFIYGLVIVSKWLYLIVSGSNNGWVQYADGTGEIWVRRESWGRWWRRITGQQKECEVEEVDEGTQERGWNWWRAAKRTVNASADEGRVRLE